MSCGDIAWWRTPDFAGLLARHGQVEHLIVQFDFLVQVQRNARAEYSIPGASKNGKGATGYADIVSIATNEIWEIKPRSLEDLASKEAGWYVTYAKVSCGSRWRSGTSYTISDWAAKKYGGGGVVYRVQGNGNKAELIAKQGKTGAVLYFWRINGKEVSVVSAAFSWALRQQVIADYFKSGQVPQPLPGSKPPNDFPPVKFKPPALRPDACIPQFAKKIPTLLKQLYSTCAPSILENSAVAVLLQVDVFNMLVGAGMVANTIRALQVNRPSPTASLYAAATSVLIDAARPGGAIEVALGAVKLYLTVTAAVVVVGAVIVVTCELAPIVAEVAGAALAADGLLSSFAAGVGSQLLRTAIAAGATILVFAVPRAASADTGMPVAFDIFLPQFILRKPGEAALRVGQTLTIDTVEWVVAGVGETLPD